MKTINMNSKIFKFILWTLAILYIVILLRVIIFKYPITMMKQIIQEIDLSRVSTRIQYGNLIPFKTIIHYMGGVPTNKIAIRNLLGNVAAFIPLGVLVPLTIRIKGFGRILVTTLVASLSLEVIQLVTGLGNFDVDDLILNTLGGVLGFLIYRLLIRSLLSDDGYTEA